MVSSLEIRNDVPVLTIDDEAIAPMMVWGGNNAKLSGTAPLMSAAGFHLYTTSFEMPWPREGEDYDFSETDAELDVLLANDRGALTMPRIGVEPPDWWKEEHPEEMPVWENGKSDRFISITSERWLGEAAAHILRYVGHLESKWGEHVFAYHPCALNSGEWYYASTIWDYADWGLRNYDVSFAHGYRRWLGKRYGNVRNLNEAWRSSYDDFT